MNMNTDNLKPVERPLRRLRVFFLDEHTLCALLRGKIKAAEIPEGMEVVRSFYDTSRMGFGVVVEHPSFDPIPDGDLIPHFGPIMLELVAPPVRVIQYAPGQSEDVKQAMREAVRRYGPEMFMPRDPEVVWAVPNGDQVITDIQETTEKIEQEPYIGLDGGLK